jgi:hypothetical protein
LSFRFTLILLGVAVVAILGFGLAQRQSPPQAGPAPTPTAVIMDLQPSTVTSFSVKSADKEASFSKDDSGWKLVRPSESSDVDQAKIGQLVSQVATLTSSRSVAKPGEDVGPYGLRSPSLMATLSGGGKTETLLVGDKNVNGNQYYAVRQEGSDVGLIPANLVTSLMDVAANPPRAAASASPASSPAA